MGLFSKELTLINDALESFINKGAFVVSLIRFNASTSQKQSSCYRLRTCSTHLQQQSLFFSLAFGISALIKRSKLLFYRHHLLINSNFWGTLYIFFFFMLPTAWRFFPEVPFQVTPWSCRGNVYFPPHCDHFSILPPWISHWAGASLLSPSPQCSSFQSWGTGLLQVKPLPCAPPAFRFWWKTPVWTQGGTKGFKRLDKGRVWRVEIFSITILSDSETLPWLSSRLHLLPHPLHLHCRHTSRSEPRWA